MAKSAQAFRTIREVADWLGVQAHVLRFWESKFSQIRPVKRAGGRRYYRPADMALVGGIKTLLHDDGLTIRGVQKLIREEGVAHVSAFSPPLDDIMDGAVIEGASDDEAPMIEVETPPAGSAQIIDLHSDDAADAQGDAASAPVSPEAQDDPSPEDAWPEDDAPMTAAADDPLPEAPDEAAIAWAEAKDAAEATAPPDPAEADPALLSDPSDDLFPADEDGFDAAEPSGDDVPDADPAPVPPEDVVQAAAAAAEAADRQLAQDESAAIEPYDMDPARPDEAFAHAGPHDDPAPAEPDDIAQAEPGEAVAATKPDDVAAHTDQNDDTAPEEPTEDVAPEDPQPAELEPADDTPGVAAAAPEPFPAIRIHQLRRRARQVPPSARADLAAIAERLSGLVARMQDEAAE